MEKPTPNTEIALYGLETLLDQLPGKVSNQNGAKFLKINPTIGNGYVKFQKLQKGIEIFNIDLSLSKDSEIFIENLSKEQLQFYYSLEGRFGYACYPIETQFIIEQFQTAVAFQKTKNRTSIIVQKEKRLILNIISINQEVYFKKFQIPNNKHGDKLSNLLKDIGEKSNFTHVGGFSLKIAEQLKKILPVDNENDISDELSEKGRYYIILAQQMEQFYEEINNETNPNTLSQVDILKIVEISDAIKSHPEASHHIKTLCRKTSLSPAKLQEGFKFMFDRTVSDYVRYVRLEKATALLLETDLTISEIVYTVGLTSRSYFCKIFKDKHKCSPKEYRKRSS